MRLVDGYLSRRAQRVWPGALVWIDDDLWTLERPGQAPVGLGQGSGRSGLDALIQAHGVADEAR